jgi:hypothetical protein
MLLFNETKFWNPILNVVQHVENEYKGKKVLEIGIDRILNVNSTFVKKADLLDFLSINYFADFAYCRHILEDLQNPEVCFSKITKMFKRGYIESSSIISEITRNVDSSNPSLWRGYINNRYMFWTDFSTNTLFCLPKLPYVEIINLYEAERKCHQLLKDPMYWNDYYSWDEDNPPNFKMIQCDNIQRDYQNLIMTGLEKGIENSLKFFEKLTVISLERKSGNEIIEDEDFVVKPSKI